MILVHLLTAPLSALENILGLAINDVVTCMALFLYRLSVAELMDKHQSLHLSLPVIDIFSVHDFLPTCLYFLPL